MLGLKSFHKAKSILSGIEAMHIIKKGQLILRDKCVQNEMKFIRNGCIRIDSIRNLYTSFK